MSKMIKQVARAIATYQLSVLRDGPRPDSDTFAQGSARAAITAMREPTEEMIIKANLRGPYDGSGYHWAKVYWRAMIDAALAECGDKK